MDAIKDVITADEQEEIKESTGESKSYGNIQHMCDHVCATCQNYLNSKQCRSYEQE